MTELSPVVIGNAALYMGDCIDLLSSLPKVGAVVTDPPYGVAGGSGTMGSASAKTKYANSGWDDTPEYIAHVCSKAVRVALELADGRGAVTPGGRNAFFYPHPTEIGCFYQPAAVGMCKWGRVTTQPILFYGRDPRVGKTIQPIHYTLTERSEDCGHPCPKPIGAMNWLVDRVSLFGETVLDPFMGSGTTGVACANLGRAFIGIEREPKYFDIACRRIDDAQRQQRMFA